MTYSEGFEQGEQAAYLHRQLGFCARFYGEPANDGEQGFQDGYTPRAPGWWYGMHTTHAQEAQA